MKNVSEMRRKTFKFLNKCGKGVTKTFIKKFQCALKKLLKLSKKRISLKVHFTNFDTILTRKERPSKIMKHGNYRSPAVSLMT